MEGDIFTLPEIQCMMVIEILISQTIKTIPRDSIHYVSSNVSHDQPWLYLI